MGARLPDGASLALATTYGAAKAITGISNAATAVADAAAHGFTAGKILEITSGWGRLNERMIRVGAAPAAGNFPLEKINTLDEQQYPPTTGLGSAREVIAWTQILQVLDFQISGGEQQFSNFSFLEEDFERQLPTVTSAQSITIQIADDDTLAGWQALALAGEIRAKRALRLMLPGSGAIYFNGVVAFNPTPTMSKGNVMAVTATLSLQGRPTRY